MGVYLMKNKRWFALALVLCMILPLAACSLKPAAPWPTLREGGLNAGGRLVTGSGKVTTNKRLQLDEGREYVLRVTGISLRGDADVELVIDEGLENELVITADDNVNQCIEVTFNALPDYEIIVDLKERVILTPTKLIITVGAPIRELDLNGAWKFTYDCPGVTACKASINGACEGKFTFGALNTLRVDVNGASNITIAGEAKLADLTINGAANIKAFDLAAVSADVTINGAGGCEITATGTLDAEINGVGKVVYGGEPAVNKRIHGLGEVRAR